MEELDLSYYEALKEVCRKWLQTDEMISTVQKACHSISLQRSTETSSLVQTAIKILNNLLIKIPEHHQDLGCVYKSLIILLAYEQRHKTVPDGGPYDVGNLAQHAPFDEDHMLSDLREGDLNGAVGDMLDTEYLGPFDKTKEGKWPVKGILFGPFKRPLVNLSVKRKNSENAINVFFLVDTGAPMTDLSSNALSAVVGSGNPVPESAALRINDSQLQVVHLSPPGGNHADLCVLGADFLSAAKLILEVNYADNTMSLRVA